jgi:hypothetical protein
VRTRGFSDLTTFGENTRDEMCFAIGFAVGSNPHAGMLDGCASRR